MNPLVGYRSVVDNNDTFITESTGDWHNRHFLDSIIFSENSTNKYKIEKEKAAKNHLDDQK